MGYAAQTVEKQNRGLNVQKKYIYIIIAVVIACGSCFWAGSLNSGKGIDTMADRIGVIQGQLDDSLGLVDSLSAENTELVRINSVLESENNRLTNIIGELRELNERLKLIISEISNANSNTRQGIKEAQTGIDSVADRIRKAIEENKTEESDNYH